MTTVTASTNVVLVTTSNLTPPYIVYLPYTTTVGRFITVRDNDGFASSSNSIRVSTTNGALFSDGTNLITINQPFGFITVTTIGNSRYSLVNTFAFPAGSATANVSNIVAQRIQTSSITFVDQANPANSITQYISNGNVFIGSTLVTNLNADSNLFSTVAGLGTAGYLSSLAGPPPANTFYNPDQYILVATGTPASGKPTIEWSMNGVTFSNALNPTNPGFAQSGADVAQGGGQFVAVGSNASGATPTTGHIQYSLDGLNWSNANQSLLGVQARSRVIQAPDSGLPTGTRAFWHAIGSNTPTALGVKETILWSLDSRNWSNANTAIFANPANDGQATGIAYGNGVWVATGDSPTSRPTVANFLVMSTDGSNWNNATTVPAAAVSAKFLDVSFNGSRFVALLSNTLPADPNSRLVMYSADGTNWTMPATTAISPIPTNQTYVVANSNNQTLITGIGNNGMQLATNVNFLFSAVPFFASGFNNVFRPQWDGSNWFVGALSNSATGPSIYRSTDALNWAPLTSQTQAFSGTGAQARGFAKVGFRYLYTDGITASNSTTINVSSINVGSLNVTNISTGNLQVSTIQTNQLIAPNASISTLTVSTIITTATTGDTTFQNILTSSLQAFSVTTTQVNVRKSNTQRSSIILAVGGAVNSGGSSIPLQSIKWSIDSGATFNNILQGGFTWQGNHTANSEILGITVAVGRSATSAGSIQYTNDGSNWFPATTGGFEILPNGVNNAAEGRQVIWSDDLMRFVAVGFDSDARRLIQVSTDGSNWAQNTSGNFPLNIGSTYFQATAIGQNGTQLVAGLQSNSPNATGAQSNIFLSTDAYNWRPSKAYTSSSNVAITSPTSFYWNATNNRWQGTSSNGVILTSADSSNWSQVQQDASRPSQGLAYSSGPADWVIAKQDNTPTNTLVQTADLSNWSQSTGNQIFLRNGTSVTTFNGYFWATGDSKVSDLAAASNVVLRSTDSSNWFPVPVQFGAPDIVDPLQLVGRNISLNQFTTNSGTTLLFDRISTVRVEAQRSQTHVISTNVIEGVDYFTTNSISTQNISASNALLQSMNVSNSAFITDIQSRTLTTSTLYISSLVVGISTTSSFTLDDLTSRNVSAFNVNTSSLTASNAFFSSIYANSANISSQVGVDATLSSLTVSSTRIRNAVISTLTVSTLLGVSTPPVSTFTDVYTSSLTVSTVNANFANLSSVNISSAQVKSATISSLNVSSLTGITFSAGSSFNDLQTSSLAVSTVNANFANLSSLNVSSAQVATAAISSLTVSSLTGFTVPIISTFNNLQTSSLAVSTVNANFANLSSLNVSSAQVATAAISSLNISSTQIGSAFISSLTFSSIRGGDSVFNTLYISSLNASSITADNGYTSSLGTSSFIAQQALVSALTVSSLAVSQGSLSTAIVSSISVNSGIFNELFTSSLRASSIITDIQQVSALSVSSLAALQGTVSSLTTSTLTGNRGKFNEKFTSSLQVSSVIGRDAQISSIRASSMIASQSYISSIYNSTISSVNAFIDNLTGSSVTSYEIATSTLIASTISTQFAIGSTIVFEQAILSTANISTLSTTVQSGNIAWFQDVTVGPIPPNPPTVQVATGFGSASNDAIQYSTDGTNFYVCNQTGGLVQGNNLVQGKDTMVIAGQGSSATTSLVWSQDGSNWYPILSGGFDNGGWDVTQSPQLNLQAAVGQDISFTPVVQVSTDALNWNPIASMPPGLTAGVTIGWGNNAFVAMANGGFALMGADNRSNYMQSTDGLNWLMANSQNTTSNFANGYAWSLNQDPSRNLWLATNQNWNSGGGITDQIYVASTDSSNWTEIPTSLVGGGGYLQSIAAKPNGIFVFAENYPLYAYPGLQQSTDGSNLTQTTVQAATMINPQSVRWIQDRFQVPSVDGVVQSIDGQNWQFCSTLFSPATTQGAIAIAAITPPPLLTKMTGGQISTAHIVASNTESTQIKSTQGFISSLSTTLARVQKQHYSSVIIVGGGTNLDRRSTIQQSLDHCSTFSTIQSGGFAQDCQSLVQAADKNLWVATGRDSSKSHTIQYSMNGLDWHGIIQGGFDSYQNDVLSPGFYGQTGHGVAQSSSLGIFVAVGESLISNQAIQVSTDGSNWYPSVNGYNVDPASPTVLGGRSIIWTGTKFITSQIPATQFQTATLWHSSDGLYWDAMYPQAQVGDIYRIWDFLQNRINNNQYAVGEGQQFISTDGFNFLSTVTTGLPTGPPNSTENIFSIDQSSAQKTYLVLARGTDKLYRSTDGSNYIPASTQFTNDISAEFGNMVRWIDDRWIITAAGYNANPNLVVQSIDNGSNWQSTINTFGQPTDTLFRTVFGITTGLLTQDHTPTLISSTLLSTQQIQGNLGRQSTIAVGTEDPPAYVITAQGNQASTILQSVDGVNFQQGAVTGGFANGAGGPIAQGNGIAVAGGQGATALDCIQWSTDGSNWNSSVSGSIPTSGPSWIDQSDPLKMFAAIGSNFTNNPADSIQLSTDGSNWNSILSFPVDTQVHAGSVGPAIAWGNGIWVAGAEFYDGSYVHGTTNQSNFVQSTDGLNWLSGNSQITSSDQYNVFPRSLYYDKWKGQWFATSENQQGGSSPFGADPVQVTSTDGSNWAEITTNLPNRPMMIATKPDGIYVFSVNDPGNVTIYQSQDGVHCFPCASDVTTANYTQSVTWAEDRFYAFGYLTGSASVFSSTDGSNWSSVNANLSAFSSGAVFGTAWKQPFGKRRPQTLETGGFISTISFVAETGQFSTLTVSTGFLHVNCSTIMSNDLTVQANINYTGALNNISDSNLKQNITLADTDLCTNIVETLPLHRFSFISTVSQQKRDKTQLGFLANEVAEVFPHAVTDVDGQLFGFSTIKMLDTYQIQYAHYGATQSLIRKVKEQQSTIEGQQALFTTLLGAFSTLQSQVSSTSNH